MQALTQFDSGVVQSMTRHQLLGEEILQALPSSLLAEAAVGNCSATLASLWASSISKSHLDTGQPFMVRLTPARANALAAISTVPRWREIPILVSWHHRLSSSQNSIVAEKDDIGMLFKQIYDIALQCQEPKVGEIKKWAQELAVILVEQERSGRSFNTTLRHLLAEERHAPGSAVARIDSFFRRQPEAYLVVVGLTGARVIEGLESLTGGKIRILKDDETFPSFAPWGGSGGYAKPFVEFLCQSAQEYKSYPLHPSVHICLEVSVEAVGVEAAAEEARRTVLRLIDMLSAVHPTAHLRMSGIVGVGAPHRDSFEIHQFDTHKAATIRVGNKFPQNPLKASIRAAALVRRFEDPLTRAAFSWIALETAGFKIDDVGNCGRALALLRLRQEAIVAHRHIVRGVGDISGLTLRHKKEANLARARSRQLRKQSPTLPEDRARITELIEMQDKRAYDADEAFERCSHRLQQATDLVNQLCVSPPGYDFGSKGFGRIVDMTSWQRQLAEMKAGEALPQIISILPTWAIGSAQHAHEVLSNDQRLRDWLNSTAEYYGRLLDGIYSARNVHLHSGVSDVPGSTSLGAAAALLSDAILEIFLLWQQSGADETPLEIVQELSRRFCDAIADPQPTSINLNYIVAPPLISSASKV